MKFRKRPVEIEAFQLLEDFFTPFLKSKEERFKPRKLPSGEIATLSSYRVDVSEKMYIIVRKSTHTLFIRTLEGDMRCKLGDWIITGVKGEQYPCKPDIFEATYEAV